LMGNWVYGCDICQAVCPFNRFAPAEVEPAYYPEAWDRAATPLLDLLALDEEEFDRRYSGSPIKRIKRERLVRNACVAAGNWGNSEALGPLGDLLRGDSPLVRGHAAWALGQIGGEQARKVLRSTLDGERDQRVRRELAQALGEIVASQID